MPGLDPARPTESHAVVFLAFEGGAAASLVYGGYDFFDSDELHGWISGRGNVLDDLAGAIHTGRKPVHDGRWGKATLEVALAIQTSAREGHEVGLEHQVTA